MQNKSRVDAFRLSTWTHHRYTRLQITEIRARDWKVFFSRGGLEKPFLNYLELVEATDFCSSTGSVPSFFLRSSLHGNTKTKKREPLVYGDNMTTVAKLVSGLVGVCALYAGVGGGGVEITYL